jgi:hypothetical protein
VILVAASLLFCPRASRAGPPFVTDDPEPVELHHWEFYFASQMMETADGRSGAAPFIDANYGAIRDLHLHVLLPMAFDAPSLGPHHYGYGDTEVGAKYRFIHETARVPQVGVFPALEIPTGDESRNLGAGQMQAFLPLWIQKSWGGSDRPWTAFGGGAYDIHPGEGNLDWGFLGIVLERQVGSSLMVGGELFHQSATVSGGTSDSEFSLGATLDVSEHHHLLASAGWSIDGPNRARVYVAYQLTTGPSE